MNLSFLKNYFPSIRPASLLKTSTAAVAFAFLTPSAPALPDGQAVGPVVSVWLKETGTRLFVSGAVRPVRSSPASHVSVQLVSPAGQVLAERRDGLTPTHPRTSSGRAGRSPYAASFPIADARLASRVRVTYHAGPRCCS